MEYTTMPAFIVTALSEAIEAGVVPSVRAGQGGNSHSVWFIKFSIRVDRDGQMSKYYDFEVKIEASYHKFLDFTLHGGHGSSGFIVMRNMAACVARARANIEALNT